VTSRLMAEIVFRTIVFRTTRISQITRSHMFKINPLPTNPRPLNNFRTPPLRDPTPIQLPSPRN